MRAFTAEPGVGGGSEALGDFPHPLKVKEVLNALAGCEVGEVPDLSKVNFWKFGPALAGLNTGVSASRNSV